MQLVPNDVAEDQQNDRIRWHQHVSLVLKLAAAYATKTQTSHSTTSCVAYVFGLHIIASALRQLKSGCGDLMLQALSS